MRFSSFIAAAGLAVSFATASPADTHMIHEKRDRLPAQWTKRAKVDSDAVVPMRIALKQRNLERAGELLNDVSHPKSANYGKHWTSKQVADMFAPEESTVRAVKEWLAESGIDDSRIKTLPGGNWLNFDIPVKDAERLLKTEYNVYQHGVSGQPHIACEEYSLPRHLSEHVDFVLPTVHFDMQVDKRKDKVKKRTVDSYPAAVQPNVGKSIGNSTVTLPKPGRKMAWSAVTPVNLATCDEQIVPACLQALYQFPNGSTAVEGNSYGIVEYTPQSYVPSDLDLFFENYLPEAVGDRPIFDSIDGGQLYNATQSFDINGESDLDLEYAMTLVYPQNVTLYQVGDLYEGASFNNFLDAIDGSYCTYEGGDDPTQDAVYPDPYPGGYKGPEDCGTFAPTNVISTSYGYNEHDLTPAYEERQCNEYMKLGLLGVTVLYSTGDYGVAGNGGQCIDPTTGEYNNGSSGAFNPSFPAGCPYVTGVGATQVIPGVDVGEAIASGTQPEEACETVIYSGGGFSNVFALPDYQSAAVKEYFATVNISYTPTLQYNASGNSRGIPDVSANGANYVVALDGEAELVYGTSASSPTFGSIITLINEARLNSSKSSVGFLNPVLYENPDVLNDVTQGSNPGCGTDGFPASTGWDPVTGLGTPNFPKMKELFLSLQ